MTWASVLVRPVPGVRNQHEIDLDWASNLLCTPLLSPMVVAMEKALEAWRTSKDVRIKMEAQTDSTSFLFQTPGIGRIKTDAQVAYEVGFGRT